MSKPEKFDDLRTLAVWWKAKPIPGFPSAEWRHDQFGRPIRYQEFGSRSSKFGWFIDQVVPAERGGEDHIDNLRPLHWERPPALQRLLQQSFELNLAGLKSEDSSIRH